MIFNYKEKDNNIKLMNSYLLAKTLSMFEYENLPETIPQTELEKLLQSNGQCFFTEHDGNYYVFNGSIGGEQDVYGNGTEFIVNNVYLGLSEQFKIETDGVLVKNDNLSLGLLPFFDKYNTLLAENELSMLLWSYNSRTQALLTADNDKSKESAESYLTKIVNGDLGVIGTNALFDGVKLQTKGSNDIGVTQFIEFQQYIKSTLFNEVGLSSNFNMKKERLISAEVDQGEDSIFAFAYSMIQSRLEAIELINAKYGLNISIDFGSVWTYKDKKLTDGVIDNEQLQETGLAESDTDSGESDLQNSNEQTESEQEESPERIELEREQGQGTATVPDLELDESADLNVEIEPVEKVESNDEIETTVETVLDEDEKGDDDE